MRSQISTFALTTFFFCFTFSTANAERYKWVDKNGKITFSNVKPPSTAKIIATAKETTESPDIRAARIEKMQKERTEQESRMQRERETRRIIQEEQSRTVTNISQQPQQRSQLASRVSTEQRLLDRRYKTEYDKCMAGKNRVTCRRALDNTYDIVRERLASDPEVYFYEKDERARTPEVNVFF